MSSRTADHGLRHAIATPSDCWDGLRSPLLFLGVMLLDLASGDMFAPKVWTAHWPRHDGHATATRRHTSKKETRRDAAMM